MNTTSLFKCVTCSNRYLTLSVEQSAIYALCAECGTMHKFDTTSGKPTLTFTTVTLAPQQEPAVQVPATAPAAGHLSTQPSDTLLDIDPYASPEASFAQCPKCTSKFFAPAVGFEQLILICENCKTGFAFTDPVNTWPQADQCHTPDLSTETVDK